MKNNIARQRMSVADLFAALASNEDFVFAVAYTNSFKKNVKLCYKQNLDLNELYKVIATLAKKETLSEKNHVHRLIGYGKEKCMECHINPDWILIWVQKDDEMILVLTNTGTHSNMF